MKFSNIRFMLRKLFFGNQIISNLMLIKDIKNTQINNNEIYNSKLDDIAKYINDINVYFYRDVGEFEKKLAMSFMNYMNNTTKEEFINFIHMDNKSIECVNLILSRLVLIANNKKYFYTIDEILSYYELMHKFYNNIISIGLKQIYIYNHYLLPIYHFEPSVFYYKVGINEINHNDRFVNKDIIDAGAFIGDSALILSEYTNKKVYAFEPVKSNFDNMIKTIELNNKTNIVPIRKGFADSQREEQIYICGSGSGLICESKVKETVELITLDEFVMNSDIEVGLIKTDLEGFEFPFLLGAINTIKRFKPVLLISVYHKPEDFFRIKPFLENLDLGYTFKFRKPVDGNVLLETILIAE